MEPKKIISWCPLNSIIQTIRKNPDSSIKWLVDWITTECPSRGLNTRRTESEIVPRKCVTNPSPPIHSYTGICPQLIRKDFL